MKTLEAHLQCVQSILGKADAINADQLIVNPEYPS